MGLKTHKNRLAIHFSNGAKFLNIGNSTEWSPIRSLIIRVINKIGRPRSGSLIFLITSKITGRIELDDTKFCYKIFDI